MNVDLGDGRVVEFPDSMSTSDVNAAIRKMMGAGGATPSTSPPSPSSPWSHFPALIGQTAANAAIGAVNAPGEVSGFLNKYTAPFLPKVLTTPLSDLVRGNVTGSDAGGGGTLPYVDFGPEAQPQNSLERYGTAALGGALTAGTIGAAQRLPAIFSGGKELLAEVPRLLRESGILGAIPGVAAEAANQNLGLDSLDPRIRTAIEAGVGATAAIAAHRFLGGNPIEAVAGKLGDSENADEAGRVAQSKVREWRGALNAKLDSLKGIAFGPQGEDVSGANMFGKVPLDDATVDNTQTMSMLHALAGKGGVYKDFFNSFVSDMPSRMQDLFRSIALRNNPIMEFGPRKEVPSSVESAGPVNEIPSQMTGGSTPPYGPNGPLRNDSFQALVPAKPPGEVGFYIPSPPESPSYVPQRGTPVGFPAPLRDAMELRSGIGEMISDPKLMPRNTSEAQWSAIYKALTSDIGNTMEHYSAGDEWTQYNTSASSLYHAGNLLSKIAGDTSEARDPVQGGKAVEALWSGMRKDSSEISNLREQVPEAADEVASAFLRNHPERWNSLPTDTQRALVPNPFDRLVLNSSAVKRESPTSNIQHLIEIPTAGTIGEKLGELMDIHDKTLGATSSASPVAWGAAAMAAPPLLRFGSKVLQNPRMLNVPATGALAASPLLASPPPKP